MPFIPLGTWWATCYLGILEDFPYLESIMAKDGADAKSGEKPEASWLFINYASWTSEMINTY